MIHAHDYSRIITTDRVIFVQASVCELFYFSELLVQRGVKIAQSEKGDMNNLMNLCSQESQYIYNYFLLLWNLRGLRVLTIKMVGHPWQQHKSIVTLPCLRYDSVVTLIGLHRIIGRASECIRNQNMTKCYNSLH